MRPNFQLARLIASFMALGVVAAWVILWILTRGGTTRLVDQETLTPQLALWAWGGLALAGFIMALFFRDRAVRAADVRMNAGTDSRRGDAEATLTNLLIGWALLEAPALVGGVLFTMFPDRRLLWAATAVYLIGLAITFPRAEWFGDGSGGAGPP